MKTKIVLLLLVVLNLLPLSGYAQEKNTSQSLIYIFEAIQKKHGYRFNYVSDVVEAIEIAPPELDWNLDQILAYLKENTGLDYVILPGNFIGVRKASLTLCGYLKNKQTSEPIPFATIKTGTSSIITDENGYFKLESTNPKEHVEIRHIGYKTLERMAALFSTEDCDTIFMIAQQQQLSEIILYDFLVRGIDQLDNGSFEIDFEKFSILPGLTELDVLQSVQAFPGIQSINETVSDINIRGGTNDQNLLLWDGIKMYQSGHFFGLISMFNPMITQKVALRKNGSPAHHTDGVSGTIEMKTEKALNPDFKGSMGINFIDASGFIDTPLGSNSSLQLAARKAISDFVESPTYSEYFSRIAQDSEIEANTSNIINSDITFDFYDTSARWLWQPTDKDYIQLNFIQTSNELVFNENAQLNGNEESRESSLRQNSIAGGLQYRRIWNARLNTQLQLYNTDYKLKAVNANILNDQRFLQENKVSETSLRIGADFKVNEAFTWTNGYQLTETKITNLDDVDDPIFRRLEGDVLRVHSVFSEIGLRSKNRQTSLNSGLRYNYLDKFSIAFIEPRLSFNHRFLNWFNLELLGEYKHQNTSQIINFQNDFLGIEKRRWQLSNDEDIPVIKSKQGSLGLSFNNKGWLANAVAYYKEVNGITSQSQGFQNQYEFIKTTGSYTAMGVDVLVRKQYKNLNSWLSYSYLNADYTFLLLPETSFPSNYDITHSLSFGLTYELERLRLAAGWNWHTGKPATLPVVESPVVDNAINYGRANAEQLEDYMRVDVSALYQINSNQKSKIIIGLSIWNLLDRKNILTNYYRLNNLQIVDEFKQNSLGITPNAVVRFHF